MEQRKKKKKKKKKLHNQRKWVRISRTKSGKETLLGLVGKEEEGGDSRK